MNTARIISNKKLTKDTHHIILDSEISFKPGQFITLILEIDGKVLRRSYSIAGSKKLELCIKRVKGGKASGFICDMKKGDEIKFLGPMGRFLLEDSEKTTFICVGTGIAPFRSMIPHIKGKKKILSGFKTSEDILYETELNKMDVDYEVVLSREKGNYRTGRVTEFLEELGVEGKFYICGLWDMVKEVKEKLKKMGVDKKNIHFERFD